MNCKYCGTELPDYAAFCTECGKKTGNAGLRLRCSECGAPLHPEGKGKTLVCPYCGSRKLLKENDGLIRSQLRAKRARERLRNQRKQEEKRLQQAENAERERQRNEERQKQRTLILERNQSKKAKRSIKREKIKQRRYEYVHSISIILVFTGLLVCFVALLVSLSRDQYSAAIVAGVQSVLLIVSFLIGMQYIPTKHDYMWLIPRFLSVLLALMYVLCYEGAIKLPWYDPWPTAGIAAYLPEPENKGTECDVRLENNRQIRIRIEGVEAATILKYIDQCKDAGYTLDAFNRDGWYKAFNEEGYSLTITDYGSIKLMYIDLEAPMEMSAFTWPHYGPYELVPNVECSKARVLTDYVDNLDIIVNDYDREAYNAYVSQCIESGYDIDFRRQDDEFYGCNKDNIQLNLEYLGMGRMKISVFRKHEK